MDKPEYSKIDPKTRALLEKVQGNRPEVLSLAELQKVTQGLDGLLTYLQKQNQNTERTSMDLADILFDVKEALDAFSSQEAPEQVDYAKPVVGAVEDLKTALTAAIDAIEVNPQVAAPNVKVEAPKVDLSGVEKAVREISKVIDAAIKNIPKTEIPKTDFTPLTSKFDEMLIKLGEIDTGVRLKPQTPNVMKVTNVDGSAIGGGSTATNYAKRVEEDSVTPGIYYFGKAVIGSADADAVWQIKRIDTTGILAETTWAEDTGTADDTFVQVWNNRESLTYS